MNTCGTCKYFGATRPGMTGDSDRNHVPAPYKACGFMLMEYKYDAIQSGSGQPAFVVDGSGYYAALCVSEDFGCNQWAEKT